MRFVTLSTRWALLYALLFFALSVPASATGGVPFIYGTNSACDDNINGFSAKTDVYVNGIGQPDGWYYIQVTNHTGTLVLGTSVDSGNPTPIAVANNEFAQCYLLWSILVKVSDGTPGYDDTNDDAYKIWVSQDPSFPAGATWTDQFVVIAGMPHDLRVIKYYDTNANGQYDGTPFVDGEPLLEGWQIRIQDGIDWIRGTPVNISLPPDIYTVTELMPLEPNWICTTTNPVTVDLTLQNRIVKFGNVCVGSGGGRTPGFWSNKNGRALIGPEDLGFLAGLNLRNLSGAHFDPTRYSDFRTWLLAGNATNMAYMLSVHMASMNLNVIHGFVGEDALISAPGTGLENGYGFATVRAVLDQANFLLGLHGTAYPTDPWRVEMEALKNALATANDDAGFFQPIPCPYTFQ